MPPLSHGPAILLPRRIRRHGFSLVELLTVVAIIALLVGILMPALGTARVESKRSATKQFIASLERGLEIFSTDIGQFPDSSRRGDPMKMKPGESAAAPAYLSGAHWLARAMVGFDGQGVDYAARSVLDSGGKYPQASFENTGPYGAQRRPAYVQKAKFAKDNTIGTGGGPQTGRIVLLDSFDFPILYYRANPRGSLAFADNAAAGPAKYLHEDNADLTGCVPDNLAGWNLASTPKLHGLAQLGDATKLKTDVATLTGFTFFGFLHDPSALKASGAAKMVNDTSFILIAAGPDGIYGTLDDVVNFK